jgi:cysteinyl-tRNA synthetase
VLDELLALKRVASECIVTAAHEMDRVLGLGLGRLTRTDLRVRPKSATIDEQTIEARLAERREARAAKDFARSDALRDELIAAGVEVMDGDPLGWDWRADI